LAPVTKRLDQIRDLFRQRGKKSSDRGSKVQAVQMSPGAIAGTAPQWVIIGAVLIVEDQADSIEPVLVDEFSFKICGPHKFGVEFQGRVTLELMPVFTSELIEHDCLGIFPFSL